MAYQAKQIANWFIERAAKDGRRLSIMTVLKLTYIAHGWHLEMRKLPLFEDKIQAWQYGPVIPSVYNAFRSQGVEIEKTLPFTEPVSEPNDMNFLEQIYGIYGGMSAFKLSDITHEKGGPWEMASRLGGAYAEIPNELILGHYEKKRLLSQMDQVAS